MPAKSTPKSSARALFHAAIQKQDLATVHQLIADGHKPDAESASIAAEACNRAFATARQTKAGLFSRKPSPEQQKKAAAEATAFYEITEALLKAGASAPAELCPAARCANTKLAILLIQHGVDVDADPPMGTPLENAVTAGDIELVRALIRAGADIHHHGIMGTLLTRAIKENHFEMVEELVKAGVDINAKPDFSSPALLTAVTDRKADLIQLLLRLGADVNVKGTITCGEFGDPEVIIENGFRRTHVPNPPVAHDATSLIVAVRRGYADIAELLIQAGADLDAVDREGLSAMAYALKSKDEAMLKLLTDAGAKQPEFAEGSLEAAFIAAAAQGNIQRLKELLGRGLNPNLKHCIGEDREQETALRRAAENGQVEAILLLVKAGAKPDEPFGSAFVELRETALMHAALKGQLESAKALIDAGASATAKDRGNKTVLHYAAEGGDAEIIRLLIKAGAKVDAKDKSGASPLMGAATQGHLQAVKALVELGADVNLSSKDRYTSLVHASSSGHTDVVRALLEAGANPKPASGQSPLEMASSFGHKEIVDLLLTAGTNARESGRKKRAADRDGAALVNAALMGQMEIVRTLLQSGANPNEIDEMGFTALMAAVRRGSLEMIQLLLQAGADVNALNKNRETALDLAYDNIRVAKDQARFLTATNEEELDADTRKAIDTVKNAGNEDEITDALCIAGGKKGKDLTNKAAPRSKESTVKPEKEPVELKIPDFSKRAKSAAFKKAIEDLKEITGSKPVPVSNVEDDTLKGCMMFRVDSKEADKILEEHHEKLLKSGSYLIKSKRGLITEKDELSLLPTNDRDEVLAAFQTNGANYETYTSDIIQFLDQMEKSHPFLLTGAGFDWCEGRFTKPLTDVKKLAKNMYEFCPDIVDQGVGDLEALAKTLKKSGKFFFWWD